MNRRISNKQSKKRQKSDVGSRARLATRKNVTKGQQQSTTVRHAASRAVSKQTGARSRVRALTLRALRDRDLSPSEIPGLVKEVVHGAMAGLDRAVPRSRHNVLRQVVDGLRDAIAAANRSTKKAARDSVERGSKSVQRDFKRSTRTLRSAEEQALEAVTRAGRSLGRAAREEISLIVAEARRAGTVIRPGLKRTVEATDGRLLELGRESGAAGMRVIREGVRTLLRGASGALDGMSEALKPTGEDSAPGRPRRTKKKGAKAPRSRRDRRL